MPSEDQINVIITIRFELNTVIIIIISIFNHNINISHHRHGNNRNILAVQNMYTIKVMASLINLN